MMETSKTYRVKLIYPNGTERMIDGATNVEYLAQGKIRITSKRGIITYYGFFEVGEDNELPTL